MKIDAGRRWQRSYWFVGTVVAAISFQGTATGAAVPLTRPHMTSLSPRLQVLFERTKTVCFGRFVLDIPASAVVLFGPAEIGPEISYLPEAGHEIARRVAQDLAEIEISREFFDKNANARLPLFGTVMDGIVPGQKITFDSKDRVGYYINAYLPVDRGLFILFYGSVMHKDYDKEEFDAIARNLRLRADDEIPDEAGTCIGGGFLPMNFEYERVRLGVRLQEFPDVHFSVDVHKNQEKLQESGQLELMLKSGEEVARARGHGDAYARIKTLRRGPRQLGQWSGFEMVARKPAYKHDTEAHEFHFHSLGAPHDPFHPEIDVRLDSGVMDNRAARTKPSLTDDEAVALWDRLLGSIRVRKTRDPKSSAPIPKKMPLGQLTMTGDICTQQGWWQCVDDGEIEGGRRRHFLAGESMPPAVLLGSPTLWQKLTGNRPTYRSATVWKLMQYDETIDSSENTLSGAAPAPPSAS